MSEVSNIERHRQLRKKFEAIPLDPILDRPLRSWITPHDLHFPQSLLGHPLRSVLDPTFCETLADRPGYGPLRMKRVLDLIERAAREIEEVAAVDSHESKSAVVELHPPVWLELDFLNDRYRQLTVRFQSLTDHPILNRSIRSWVHRRDRHLPQKTLSRSLGELLDPTVWDELCNTPGIGHGRLAKLLDLMDRAEREVRPAEAVGTSSGALPVVSPADLPSEDDWPSESTWIAWVEIIRCHRLDSQPLGRFARRLTDLAQGLWALPLSRFLDESIADLLASPGFGPVRSRQVLAVVADVARIFSPSNATIPLRGRLLCDHLNAVVGWIDEILAEQRLPDSQAVRTRFLEPLFAQFRLDLGADDCAMVRRRWGVDAPFVTLEVIALETGLTRERIRQKTAKVAEVIDVRWPEGKHLLDDLYEFFRASRGADEQLQIVRTVLDSCFEVDLARSGSQAEILAAWNRAGRNKRTPMSAEEMRSWSANEFPQLPPNVALNWLREDGLGGTAADGTELFFSRDPLDLLLYNLFRIDEPWTMDEVLAIAPGNERNVQGRLERDPRFLRDERNRYVASELRSFFREAGIWSVRLEPNANARAASVPVQNLSHLIVGGFLQAGIADASVWGVHRYANDVLGSVYGGRLPANVTPIILSDMLIRLSNDMIRTMRRRRLRWDTADGSVPVRGKRGWMNEVVARAGGPITFEELQAGLGEAYQDYEDYVFSQIAADDSEDGPDRLTFRMTPGHSSRIPRFYIPENWELNSECTNVSKSTLAFARRVLSSPKGLRYSVVMH